jgi:Tfp pilus assembly PilM family ATPase
MARPSAFAPPPPSLAIEIARRRVTVVQIGRSSGGPVVTAHASEPLASGVVVPALTGTNIPDVAAVADPLRRALERAGLRSARRAALVVPDGIARVSLLTFEKVPPKAADFDQFLRWQLKKGTPFPIEEAQVSAVPAHVDSTGSTFAATAVRRDVIAQYEAVTDAAGVHAGLVDLASFNVMNAVMAAGAATPEDWLVVCLAPEGTTLAILRGSQLMFYRHRPAVEAEPLAVLVHQTSMYHEDRLGGARFARVWVHGANEAARREIAGRLGVSVEAVDVQPAASLRDRGADAAEVLQSITAGVGILLRERKAA